MRFRQGRQLRRSGPFRVGPPLFGRRRGGRIAAALLAQLDQANQFLAQGYPAQAAPIFAGLAQQAEARDMPQRAAHLHLEAARCYFQVRDSASGLSQARAGLQAFINMGSPEKASNAYARLLAGLRTNGLAAEVETLQKEFAAQLGDGAVQATPEAQADAQPRGQLPAKCPSCNGPIRNDEVDWIDAQSAECPYCGTTLQAQ